MPWQLVPASESFLVACSLPPESARHGHGRFHVDSELDLSSDSVGRAWHRDGSHDLNAEPGHVRAPAQRPSDAGCSQLPLTYTSLVA